MKRIDVYVPNPDDFGTHTDHIDPRSGIVGRRMVLVDDESPVILYYESNRYGAVNIVTFADRCMLAADRMTQDYPTVATTLVPCDAVVRVGSYLPEHRRVEVYDGLSLMRLARWVEDGLTDPDFVPSKGFSAQLLCSPRPMSAAQARDYMIRRHYTPDDAA